MIDSDLFSFRLLYALQKLMSSVVTVAKKKRTQLAKMKDFALQTLRAPLYVNFLPTVQQFL